MHTKLLIDTISLGLWLDWIEVESAHGANSPSAIRGFMDLGIAVINGLTWHGPPYDTVMR